MQTLYLLLILVFCFRYAFRFVWCNGLIDSFVKRYLHGWDVCHFNFDSHVRSNLFSSWDLDANRGWGWWVVAEGGGGVGGWGWGWGWWLRVGVGLVAEGGGGGGGWGWGWGWWMRVGWGWWMRVGVGVVDEGGGGGWGWGGGGGWGWGWGWWMREGGPDGHHWDQHPEASEIINTHLKVGHTNISSTCGRFSDVL